MGQRHSRITTATLLALSFVAPAGLAAPVPVELAHEVAAGAPDGGRLENWSAPNSSIQAGMPCAGLASVACDSGEDYAVLMTANTQDGTARITGDASGVYSPEPRSPLASVMARPTLSVLLLAFVVFLTVWWSIGRRE